ncbi:MAG: endonuclease/exonuclease/phosphatase family protein [Hydrogenophilus sp.]|nr:endonuclease/exonuclease/phosphatase family protein [Hydrogenophilus sp.]
MVTYNIHKGGRREEQLLAIGEALRGIEATVLLLQEVQGGGGERERAPQHQVIAAEGWPYTVYGGNRFYRRGHHGNAVMSRVPIVAAINHDLTAARRWESRGALQATVVVGGVEVYCFSVHLGLRRRWRWWQLGRLRELVEALPEGAPVVVGGDFNDWRGDQCAAWERRSGLSAVVPKGRRATFPARGVQLMTLDRLFVRGLEVVEARVLRGRPWSQLSDHLPVWARLRVPTQGAGE